MTDNVRFFNEQSAVTPEVILAQAAAFKPKRIAVVLIDENDLQRTLTSVMTGEQLAWLNLCFTAQMQSMTKPS